MGGRLRPGGMHRRLRCGGNGRRLSRQEKRPWALRAVFRAVFGWNALRREPSSVCFVAADWRSGDRRSISDFSELYCGDRSHAGARPMCHALPARDRGRNSRCCFRQHADSAHGRRSVERILRLALDVFCGSCSGDSFGLMILPAVESPRWLMKMGRRDQAIEVLAKINGPEAAKREAVEIENSLATEEGHISELFTTFRRPLLLGIMLAGCNRSAESLRYFLFCRRFFVLPGPRPATHFSNRCW